MRRMIPHAGTRRKRCARCSARPMQALFERCNPPTQRTLFKALDLFGGLDECHALAGVIFAGASLPASFWRNIIQPAVPVNPSV
jgi:hypothetical protein